MSTYTSTGGSSLALQEQYLYGSSRLVVLENGNRSYEITDHLGNVRVVLSEFKEVKAAYEYYAFGMSLAKIDNGYRYGFNGKENDGENNLQDYGMRQYNVRTCRFISVDPLLADYPFYTTYQFSGNSPIMSLDIDGMEPDKKANEVEKANEKLNNFECDESIKSGVYNNVSKEDFVKGLRDIINDKNGYAMAQATCGDGSFLCNTAALLNDYENLKPEEFAQFAIDMYTTGTGSLNGTTFKVNGDQTSYVNSEKSVANFSSKNPVDLIVMLAVRFNGGNYKEGDEMGFSFTKLKGGATFGEVVDMYKTLFKDIKSHGRAVNLTGDVQEDEIKDLAPKVNSGKIRLTALISHKLDRNKGMIGKGGIGTHFVNIHNITFVGKNRVLVDYGDYGRDNKPIEMSIGRFKRSLKGLIILEGN